MTKHMFTPAAIACLVDGRSPRPEEVDQLAAKIWCEAYRRVWKMEWSEVKPGSRLHASIQAAALMGLGALATLTPDHFNAVF